MSGPGLTRRIINAAAVAPMPAEISRCYEQIKKMDGETCGKRLDFACNRSRLRLCGLTELAVRVREGLHAWQALPATEKLQDGEALESMVRVDLASRARTLKSFRRYQILCAGPGLRNARHWFTWALRSVCCHILL